MRNIIVIMFTLLVMAGFYSKSNAHCEVPCGIYDDEMRIHMIKEDILTIEKAIQKIKELSAKKDKTPKDYNQLVRWIDTKEKHAKRIQEIAWQYFLTQRVKPVDSHYHQDTETYIQKVTLLHQMLFYAMKAKQNVDTKYTDILREVLEKFEKAYFGKAHIEEHHHH